MTVVVGFSTKPEGHAALAAAVTESRRRATRLVVVPNTAADAEAVPEALAGQQVAHDVVAPSDLGLVGERILDVADEVGAEIIIIGLRRRSPTGKLLLGLNAQKVLLDAGAPVMAVKADS
ncbi:universal stress protein [Mariniluteicoccus flavus]